MHDQVTTSRQNPSVNGGGRVYAVSAGHGTLVVLDPKTNETNEIEIPTREAHARSSVHDSLRRIRRLCGGDRNACGTGRLQHRRSAQSDARQQRPRLDDLEDSQSGEPDMVLGCGSNKYVAWFGSESGGARRRTTIRRPEVPVDRNLLRTHHLQFDNDPNETVYFNELSGPIVGWVDSKVYDETLAATKDEIKAEQAAVGWCASDPRHQRRRQDHQAVADCASRRFR